MFGFHAPELIIILVVALIIFGPKRLPEIGGALGKGIKEFKAGTSDNDEHTLPDSTTHISTAETATMHDPTVETQPTETRKNVS